MFRTTDIVLVTVMVAAAAFTYTTKHDAEAELAKLRKLQADIRFEENTINVLKADWSLLTQPSRLQSLAEIYYDELQLVPAEAHQFVDLGELPAAPLEIEDILEDRLGEMVDSGVDETTVTGGIDR